VRPQSIRDFGLRWRFSMASVITGRFRTWHVSPSTTPPETPAADCAQPARTSSWPPAMHESESESEEEGVFHQSRSNTSTVSASPAVNSCSAAWERLMLCSGPGSDEPSPWYLTEAPAAAGGWAESRGAAPVTPPKRDEPSGGRPAGTPSPRTSAPLDDASYEASDEASSAPRG